MEYTCAKPIGVKTLEHFIKLRFASGGYTCEAFDTCNPCKPHVLSDFNRVCTPRSGHFTARPYEAAFN